MDWDDLKLLLAVADGGVTGAARDLATDPLRVGKRIAALERSLRCSLVTADGALTASGRRAVAVARGIATQVADLANELGGATGEIAGRLCVSSTATFLSQAQKAFAGLRDTHPALSIEMMVSSQVVDLQRNQADIAVRMFRDQQPGLAMRKLGSMGWSLYASAQYLADHPNGAGLLDGHRVIGYDASFSNTSGGRWITANAPADAIAVRVGNLREALDAAAAHHGVAVVPCYLGAEVGLARVTDQVLTSNDVYAVYLAERSTEARLVVLTDALVALFEREGTAYSGATA